MGTRGKKKPDWSRKKDPPKRREPKAWERQKKESVGSFEGFVIYRDMLKRSYPKTAKVLDRTADAITQLGHRNNWCMRAEQWDNELDRRMQDAEISAAQAMVKRQIGLSVGLQEAAALELQALVRRIKRLEEVALQTNHARKPLLSAKEIVRLAEAGTKLERVNRGEPTEITKTDGPSEIMVRFVGKDDKLE